MTNAGFGPTANLELLEFMSLGDDVMRDNVTESET